MGYVKKKKERKNFSRTCLITQSRPKTLEKQHIMSRSEEIQEKLQHKLLSGSRENRENTRIMILNPMEAIRVT